MAIALENFDLAGDALDVSDLHDALLLEDLDSDLLASREVESDFHLPKRAFADRFAQDVLTHDVARFA